MADDNKPIDLRRWVVRGLLWAVSATVLAVGLFATAVGYRAHRDPDHGWRWHAYKLLDDRLHVEASDELVPEDKSRVDEMKHHGDWLEARQQQRKQASGK